MIETLDAVFVNGSGLKELLQPVSGGRISVPRSVVDDGHFPLIAPAVFVGGVDVGFVSSRVVRNLRKRFVFYAGGVLVLLWGDLKPADFEELLNRLHSVAISSKDRLIVDFPKDDIRSALSMFDRRFVRQGFGPGVYSDVKKFLYRAVRKCATLLGADETAAVLQYHGVLPYLLRQMEPLQPLAGKSNQEAWALLLDDKVWDEACKQRLRATDGSLHRVI